MINNAKELREYIENQFKKQKSEEKYWIYLGRAYDEKHLRENIGNIVAWLENEFGFAFILKGKKGFFCYILMKEIMLGTGTYAHNRLIRIPKEKSCNYHNRIDEAEFLNEFNDSLIIEQTDNFAEFKNKIMLRALKK
jgi:hypothetical protein